MDRQQRFLIKQQRINNNLFSGIMFIIGSIFYALSFTISVDEPINQVEPVDKDFPKRKEEPFQKQILKELGLILISASAATLIFGWATRADAITTTAVIVNTAIDKAIHPMINFINQNAIRNFRWDCWLGLIRDDLKNKYSDNYLYQRINMSYTKNQIEEDLRVIFAIGNKDGVLRDYFDDERYIINYKIECKNEELSIKDDNVCKIIDLKLNGDSQPIVKPKYLIVNGSNAKEYIYIVPSKYLSTPVTISICFSVLKWVPGDNRIFIPKQIFETTIDSEFRISISEEVGVKNIIIDTTEITAILPKQNIMTEVIQNNFGKDVAASIVFRDPVLPGSSVRFELQRV